MPSICPSICLSISPFRPAVYRKSETSRAFRLHSPLFFCCSSIVLPAYYLNQPSTAFSQMSIFFIRLSTLQSVTCFNIGRFFVCSFMQLPFILSLWILNHRTPIPKKSVAVAEKPSPLVSHLDQLCLLLLHRVSFWSIVSQSILSPAILWVDQSTCSLQNSEYRRFSETPLFCPPPHPDRSTGRTEKKRRNVSLLL